ncbi:MAG: hypothetical protein R3F17_14175 [Planctomycetota bacterium]
MPDNVIVELAPVKRELDQSRKSLVLALLLAIFLVYVVMATSSSPRCSRSSSVSVPLAGASAWPTCWPGKSCPYRWSFSGV